MDYIADNYLSRRKAPSKETAVFYSIYQQLGLLWELLGCRCEHRDGYGKKGNNLVCKICGKVKGTKERYYLLPVTGKKVIGRMVRPGKGRLKKMPILLSYDKHGKLVEVELLR